MIRGPYWTGALTCSVAVPHVVVPQAQRRAMSRCSLTRTVITGRSNTCRRSTTSGAPARSAPHPAHGPGSWRSVSFSGQRPAPASTPDARTAHPACAHPCRATSAARAWQTTNPTTAASTSSDCCAPNCRRSSAISPRNSATTARSPPTISRNSTFPAEERRFRSKLLIGRMRIGRHTTMISKPEPRSTSHAEDLTSHPQPKSCRSPTRCQS